MTTIDSHEMTRISREHRKLERLHQACLMADAALIAARSGAWDETPRPLVEALGLLREARDELRERMRRVTQEGRTPGGEGGGAGASEEDTRGGEGTGKCKHCGNVACTFHHPICAEALYEREQVYRRQKAKQGLTPTG